jgi:multisubunit Na+/H+ antiporter MnhB subunit
MAWFDIMGSIGVVLIVLAYAAVQMRKMHSEQLSYSVINLIGAAMILVSLRYNFNLASFIIEVFWILISLWGIVLWFRHRKTSNAPSSESPY